MHGAPPLSALVPTGIGWMGADMNRREFLTRVGAAGVVILAPSAALAGPRADYSNLLILIELKGGNDGLNTVIPFGSPEYYSLRPRLAISRDQALQLDSTTGLHPAME